MGPNGRRTCVVIPYVELYIRIHLLRGDPPLRAIRLHLLQLFLHILSAFHVPHNIVQCDDRDDGDIELLFNLLHGGSGSLLTSFLTVDQLDDADEFCLGVALKDGNGFPDGFLEGGKKN